MRRASVLAFGLLIAAVASAVIPQASRVAAAAAKQNKFAGRDQPLRLEVVMRDVHGDPIGRGSLVTHPSGLARLELRGAGDLIERHLLQGAEHLAARNGERLDEPQAFLPPLFLLQMDSLLGLQTGLSELGADIASIGLATCGDSDCYVIGDPGRVPPEYEPPPSQPLDEAEAVMVEEFLDDQAYVTSGLERPLDTERNEPLLFEGPFASLWVDLMSFDTKRIDLKSGVVVWLGPPRMFGHVQIPSWFRVDEPGRSEVVFDVLEVDPVDTPAAAFSKSWLYTPVGTPAAGAEDSGGATATGPEPNLQENR
ncbi:MAG: hypothetical protein VX246_13605 [Myxococcota bacterium]|nr:hypothetical protein [Myxococcota bacterium]